jgi:hypothetical protein
MSFIYPNGWNRKLEAHWLPFYKAIDFSFGSPGESDLLLEECFPFVLGVL